MKYKINTQKCDVCTCCASVCPQDAIRVTEQYAYIIPELCIGCGYCMIVCPISAIDEVQDD